MSAYHKKFVAAVKCNGQVLREHEDTVYIPFGSEYSIYLKNLDAHRRAFVNIEIDGRDVLAGNQLVISSNSELDLKRWLVENDRGEGPRFKFVERTTGIEKTRGVQALDGIVIITFRYEEPPVITPYYPPFGGSKIRSPWEPMNYFVGNSNVSYTSKVDSAQHEVLCSAADRPRSFTKSLNDAGITVKGEDIRQGFRDTSLRGTLSDPENIIFKLLGGVAPKPVYVRTKITCDSCNAKNSSKNKFCSQCGENLKYSKG